MRKGVMTMFYRSLARFSVILLVGLFLVSCIPSSDRISHILRSLPVPSNSSMLARQDGVRQGSEDACFFPYTKLLYGSNDSIEAVHEFYQTALAASSWQVYSDELVAPGDFTWKKDKAFRLFLSTMPDLDFPPETVAKARNDYGTVYFLVISYADRHARTKCLGETE